MKQIQSKDNPLYKKALRIAQGRKVGRETWVWLEGIHLCQAWLDRGYEVAQLWVDAERLELDQELQQLIKRVPAQQIIQLPSALMRQLSQVEHGQGVGAVAAMPEHVLGQTIHHSCVYLDRVQDPGNVGTLLRTVAAAGIDAVYLSSGCAAVWSQKVLRSAQGAHFALQLYENVSIDDFLERLRVPLYVTALEQAQSLYTMKLPPKVAWAFGNEGQGVAPALLQTASQAVFIPQSTAVESLNVAVAAAVCLFEHRRQHGVN